MSDTNPLRQVYDTLWDTLEANSEFAALVLVGNRIKHQGKLRDPEKQDVSGRDLPEVRIIPSQFQPHLFRTSNGASLLVRYEIQVASGSRLTETVFDVGWAVFRALSNWSALLTALTWQGASFVKKCRPIAAETTLGSGAMNRGIVGWATVWTGEVEMWFDTDDLQGSGT